MENKYITVAYKLYVMQDGQKTLVEEATVEHPFQFISGLGTTLERFETEITALKKGDKFKFVIPTAEAYGEYMPEGVRTVSKDMFTIDGVLMKNASSRELSFPYRTMRDITSTLP